MSPAQPRGDLVHTMVRVPREAWTAVAVLAAKTRATRAEVVAVMIGLLADRPDWQDAVEAAIREGRDQAPDA